MVIFTYLANRFTISFTFLFFPFTAMNLIGTFIKKQLFPLSLLTISRDYISAMVINPRNRCPMTLLLKLGIFFSYFYLFVAIARFICCAVTLNYPSVLPRYLDYDFLMGHFVRLHFMDRYFASVVWPTVFLSLLFDYTVRFTGDCHTYRLAYQLIVVNKKSFFRRNPQLLNACNFVKVFRNKSKQKALKLNSTKLKHFPQLDHSVCTQAALLSFIFDFLIAIFVLFLSFLGVILVLGFWASFAGVYPFWQELIMLFDGALAVYFFCHTMKIIFFFVHLMNLLLTVYSSQQVVNNVTLESAWRIKTGSKSFKHSQKWIQKSVASFVPIFLRSHFHFITDLQLINREFISPRLFLTVMTIFGENIYCVTSLALKQMSTLENTILLVIIFCGTTFLWLSVWPMMKAARAVSSASSYLFQSQGYLQNFLLLRMKVATYYQILSSGDRIACNVGPIGKVTTNAIFQVSFLKMAKQFLSIFCHLVSLHLRRKLNVLCLYHTSKRQLSRLAVWCSMPFFTCTN